VHTRWWSVGKKSAAHQATNHVKCHKLPLQLQNAWRRASVNVSLKSDFFLNYIFNKLFLAVLFKLIMQ